MTDADPEVNPGDWPRAAILAFWAATALLGVVVVVAGARLSAGGWVAMADDAFLTMRSRGVFGGHPPLLSTASSAGSGMEAFNHPGALMLWLTAPVVGLLGSGAMPLAVSSLNAIVIATTAALLRRNARVVQAAIILMALAALCLSMGSGFLADIWNPHANLLPYFLAVVATWAVLRGDRPALPVAIFVVSVVAQTHISYAAMSIPLVAVLVGATLWRIAAARRGGDAREAAVWSKWALAAFAVALLSLALPLIEQLAGGSDGNIARILRGSGGQEPGVGAATGLSLVLDKVVVPPFFLRGSWHPPEYLGGSLHGIASVAAGLLLAGAFAWTIVSAQRRRDAALRDLATLVAGLLLCGWVVAASMPAYNDLVRLPSSAWLWVLAALVPATLMARPGELLGRRLGAKGQGHVATAACVLAGLLGLATVPSHNEDLSGSLPREQEVLNDLWSQAGDRLSELSAVEVDGSGPGGSLFIVPGLINALDEAGVDVGLTHEGQVQQAGSWSRATGEEAWLLTVRGHGENPGGNAELLAEHSPTNPRREKMLRERLADIADAMTPFDLVPAESLNPAAKADLVDPVIREWRTDPLGTMESVKFLILLHSEIIDVRGQDDDELRAILEELRAVADYEMALWLTPRGS